MGRRERPKPRDLTDSWPTTPLDDPATESVRRYVLALTEHIGTDSVRSIAARTQVDNSTLAAVLRGDAWPDAITVARTENGLGARLWHGPVAPPEGSS